MNDLQADSADNPPIRNMAKIAAGFLQTDDGPILVIDPSWTDEDVVDGYVNVLSQQVPLEGVIERSIWHGYSARQCDDLGVERGSQWGDDGELATWIMVAELTAL